MSEASAPGDVTQRALAELHAQIGTPLRVEQWNHEATRDAIRHYAHGIGDDNPLWSDPDYARTARYGGIIAPPTFLYSIFDGVVAPGLPGYSWFYAGADWQFDRPVRLGEAITASATVSGARDVGGKRVERMILQSGRTEYRTLAGERLARLEAHTFRVAKKSDGNGGMPFAPRPQHRYTEQEFAAIERMVMNEYRRGSGWLEVSEVAVGMQLPTIARGPLVPIDMTTYYAGAIGTAGYKSTKMRWLYRDLALNAPDRLPNTLPPEYFSEGLTASMGHTDPAAAAAAGMPGVYDNGLQRTAFMITAVTNWMGDNAMLRAASVRIKAPVIFGDTTFVKASVSALSEEDGADLVEIALRAENQLGETTATGTATVELHRPAP
ncbi:MaoC/PaaZ C-terminal domain-containing protein [Chelativorans sp. Marseille-P2723]|uniref:MaoC/PaaZ C-terminal domain-containing protein n=1 Tax=Chelativorans sp. Marseille-P2723 TaxID=2709133 RepID=UPI00156D829E|nr:MaoC/PaaZ C-terminal domain-containing protein [Chelativorans sp. Marseille-P2723]